MSRIIQPDEIRAGDKIRIIEEVTVSEYYGGGSFSFTEDTNPHVRIWCLPPQAEVQLINRPLNLPTETGSILRITLQGGERGSGAWLLLDEGDRPTWISARGTRFAPASLEAWVSLHGHSVEVIA